MRIDLANSRKSLEENFYPCLFLQFERLEYLWILPLDPLPVLEAPSSSSLGENLHSLVEIAPAIGKGVLIMYFC